MEVFSEDILSTHLRTYLDSCDRNELVTLLRSAAGHDPVLRQRLELHAVTSPDNPPPPETLTENIAGVLSLDSFLDREASQDYAELVEELTNRLLGLQRAGHSQLLLRPVREGLRLIGEAFDSLDGPVDRVRRSADRLAAIHVRLCKTAHPDPVELADWLLEFQTAGHHWPTLELADYHQALGPEGLERYTDQLLASWDDQGCDYRGYRVDHLVEQLAVTTRNTDLLVQVLTRHHPTGAQYHRAIQALTAAGRTGEALEWAEHAISAAEARSDQALVDFVAEHYAAANRQSDVYAVRRASFESSRTLYAYQALCAAAEPIGLWQKTREWALQLIRPTGGPGVQTHVIIDALLWEQDFEEAWDAAHQYGADPRQWMALAALRSADHPDETILVYQRLIKQKMAAKQKTASTEAAQLAAKVVNLMAPSSPQQSAEFLADLRRAHRTRRTFLTELDRLGLS